MPSPSTTVTRRLVCLGAGGHAAVVLDAVATRPDLEAVGLLDADPTRHGAKVLGTRVLGDEERIESLRDEGIDGFVLGFGGVGSGADRARLFARAVAAGLAPVTVMHAAATVAPSAHLGAGVVVLAGAIVNARARLGDGVIVNTGAIVEHDVLVGAHAHVAPGAVVLGAVSVGEEAHIGAGAVIREGLAVGPQAVVGAGAVVVRDVGEGETVVGVPARIVTR